MKNLLHGPSPAAQQFETKSGNKDLI